MRQGAHEIGEVLFGRNMDHFLSFLGSYLVRRMEDATYMATGGTLRATIHSHRAQIFRLPQEKKHRSAGSRSSKME